MVNMYVKRLNANKSIILYARKPNTRAWTMMINYEDNRGWLLVDYSQELPTRTEVQHVMGSDRRIGFKPKVVGYKKFTVVHKVLGAVPEQ